MVNLEILFFVLAFSLPACSFISLCVQCCQDDSVPERTALIDKASANDSSSEPKINLPV